MELPGKKVSYDPAFWPYRGETNTEAIQQQLHFVIDTKKLTSMYRTLGHFDKSCHEALSSITVLEFIAEAITNTLRYRGNHAGKLWHGGEPRATVMLSYITRHIWSNEEDRLELFDMSELLTEDNVVALMFSVLITDRDLSLSDAFSDQMRINEFGPPKFKKTKPNNNNNDEEDQDEDNMDVDGRLDVPGERLDARGSRYFFPQNRDRTSTLEPSVRYSKSIDNIFRVISGNMAYTRLACMQELKINESMPALARQSDDFLLEDLEADSQLRPENAFSLDRALAKLAELGANPIFTQRSSWINTWRSQEDHAETFGAPYYRAGRMPDSEFDYPAGTVKCTAYFPLKHFNARDLMEYCLPHVEISDLDLIQPNRARQRHHVVGENDNFMLEDYMSSLGLKTVAEQMREDKERNRNQDLFNEYYDKFSERAANIDELLVDLREPSAEYIEELRRLQRQGYAYYSSVMDPNQKKLPEGYRALQLYIWERTDWTPHYDKLWQTAEVAMTPFAQYKVHELVMDDELVKISDNTLLLKSRMMRAIYTIYLPRMGKLLHKEHSQVVGTPGTSKSHTLFNLVSMLIPGTYEEKSGGSMMGMIGELKSQRMLTLYQELPNLLAPDGDYKGDADKHLRMKLAQLGDGVTEYSTTREVTLPNGDKTREGVSTSAEYTNVVLGARNVKTVHATAGGAVEAMYDRFTQIQQRQILPKGRVNLINRVLEASRKEMNSGLAKVKDQYHLMHRAIMEYGALMACYAVPLPDLSLFTVLAPLAVGYLAQLRPELHFQLRNISRIKTRMYVEVVMFAVRMALTSALNPTLQHVDGKVKFDEYNTATAMNEIQKYAYSTLDQLVYVLTESMYELTTAESFPITQAFAERYSDYFAMGRQKADHKPTDQRPRWANVGPNGQAAPHMQEIGQLAPSFAGVENFIKEYKREGIFMLGMPTGVHISRMRSTVGKTGREAQYSRFELTEVSIEPEYEELFMLNAKPTQAFFKLERAEEPKYKMEYLPNGSEYINPNYVTIKSSIQDFARLVAGRIGEYQLNEASVMGLLHDLRKKSIVTTYMPCIERKSPLRVKNISDIQSLRYIREAMRQFPKYKVPVLINNPHEGEFYLLISYFETDPYGVVNNMVRHICYHSTFARKSIMGIPSQQHCLHYQPFSIRPEPDKTLVIARKSNINPATYKLLQDYTDNIEFEIEQSDTVWHEKDMEEEFAMQFLKRYNPTAGDLELKRYTPRGIWSRLYGPGGYYTAQRARQENLLDQEYPRVFTQHNEITMPGNPVPRPPPAQYPNAMVVAAGKRKEIADAEEAFAKRQKQPSALDPMSDPNMPLDFNLF